MTSASVAVAAPAERSGADARLAAALDGPPPRRVAEVVARMRAIDEALPPADGVASFNRLYLAVTRAVDRRLPRFAAPAFVARLDVVFAELYFDALRAELASPGRGPRAWRPLVEARSRPGVVAIQHALAGLNAHINGDLPVAVVQTCLELGVEPRRDGPEHADFLLVNALLAEVEEDVKRGYLTGALALGDEALGRLDDVVAMWNVERARDAAWANAETLWALRDLPAASSRYLLALDRMVGFAGRGLLRPVLERPPSRLARLVAPLRGWRRRLRRLRR